MKKIMIVDDEEDLRDMIHLIVQKEGYATMTAENGDDLLTKIDVFHPDLVTLDVMMPGLSTSDILKKIKGKTTHPKIILLTVVRFTEKEKQNLMENGLVVDYLTKPFEVKQLLSTIQKHLTDK